MIKSKRFKKGLSVIVVFGLALVNGAAAGDRTSSRATSVRTTWHSIEVGDEGGHTIAVFENKNVYVNDQTGERSTGVSSGLLDMNFKTGEGTINGYVVRTYSNGDTVISKTDGKPAGKGRSRGTFTVIRGTGRFEGMKGHGTWSSTSLAPGISELIIEGETEMPGK